MEETLRMYTTLYQEEIGGGLGGRNCKGTWGNFGVMPVFIIDRVKVLRIHTYIKTH
jgi:hypothetical protein